MECAIRAGELGESPASLWIARDTVYVVDYGNQRINRYLLDGETAGSLPLRWAGGIAFNWHVDGRSRVLRSLRLMAGAEASPEELIVERRPDGSVGDTLLAFQAIDEFTMGRRGPELTVFSPQTRWALGPDGAILFGTDHEYRISRFGPGGALELAFTYPAKPQPVGGAEQRFYRDASVRLWESRLPPSMHHRLRQNVVFHETLPLFATVAYGPDGTAWIQRFQNLAQSHSGGDVTFDPERDLGGRDWDIFDAGGRFLGRLVFPDRFTLLKIEGNAVYGVQRDKSDVQQVVKLEVGRP